VCKLTTLSLFLLLSLNCHNLVGTILYLEDGP